MSTLPLTDLVALAERIADDGGNHADLGRAVGRTRAAVRVRLVKAGRDDLVARLSANGRSATGRAASAAQAEREREERFGEIRWLLDAGVHPEVIAARLGVTVGAISRQAYRWGADDLAATFGRVQRRERAKGVAA